MEFVGYEEQARTYALYPEEISVAGNRARYLYPAIGLAGETGEVLEQIKKCLRNDNGVITEERKENLKSELGDCLWYLANLTKEIKDATRDETFTLSGIAQYNIDKLEDRRKRGKIKSR